MEGKEILAVVDSVSSEKGLEKDVIFVASRALPLQGRSHRFKSCSAHKGFSEIFTYIYPKDT